SEFLQQTLTDLVRPLILGDLLAEQENRLVAAHLLGHRIAQRVAGGHRGGYAAVLPRRRGNTRGRGRGCRQRWSSRPRLRRGFLTALGSRRRLRDGADFFTITCYHGNWRVYRDVL